MTTTARTVTIPACEEHDGYSSMTVTLPWICLECGKPRGEPFETISYDGSRRLGVHGWRNPCGHVEKYSAVRASLSNTPSLTEQAMASALDALIERARS